MIDSSKNGFPTGELFLDWIFPFFLQNSEAYLESSQTSTIELFCTIIFAKKASS